MILLYNIRNVSYRYDYDGNFQATPGMRRAVREAAEILQSRGHDVVPFTPPGLDKVNHLYGQFMMADQGSSTLELLEGGPVDMGALGVFYRGIATPYWIRKMVAPVLGLLYSPMIAGFITAEDDGKSSKQLWKHNAKYASTKRNLFYN